MSASSEPMINKISLRIFYLLFFILLFNSVVNAQLVVPKPGEVVKKEAKDNFEYGNYKAALGEYLALMTKEPDNAEYNYRIGICYLNTYIDRSYAIQYLNKAISLGKTDKDIYYDLGMAYLQNDSLDKAIESFNKYKSTVSQGGKVVEAIRQIEMCNNAKVLMKKPVNVSFENLGKKVNSPEADFNPFVPSDESFVVFSTKRKEVMGNNLDFDGAKCSDVFVSFDKNGEFQKAKNLGATINTEWVEEVVGLSADGGYILIGIDNIEGYDDIWVSESKTRGSKISFQKSTTLGPYINTVETETAASLTLDGNTIYFSRTPLENPGFGGTDIYVAHKLPNGSWSIPVNLGPTINTQYDDEFPYISGDGKTLYFASKGHNSMGGYDVFRSDWDERMKRWSRPQNIGYPINNTMDNYTFSRSENSRYGYVSALRPGGFGDLDIYRITYNDVEDQESVVTGKVQVMEKPEKQFINFHIFTNDTSGKEVWFTDHWFPEGKPFWKFKENKKMEIPEGYFYDVTIIGILNGEYKKFTGETFPKDAADFNGVETRASKKPIPNYKPVTAETKSILEKKDLDVSINVLDTKSGDVIGSYKPGKNGNYVIILQPGKYKLEVEADGYDKISEDLDIYDKSSFLPEILKDITLMQVGLLPQK